MSDIVCQRWIWYDRKRILVAAHQEVGNHAMSVSVLAPPNHGLLLMRHTGQKPLIHTRSDLSACLTAGTV